MATSNSITSDLLRSGHYLKLFSDRQWYVSFVLSRGDFLFAKLAAKRKHLTPGSKSAKTLLHA